MSALLAIAVTSTALFSQGPDLSRLNAKQRKMFEQVAAEEFCHCTSALTLSGCLNMRPDCNFANHLAQLVYIGARADIEADEMLAYLAQVTAPLCSKPAKLKTDTALAKGPESSPITIVEFADFRCGHCAEAAPIVHKTLEENKDVRFFFVPFPLRDHPEGIAAAEAMFAAAAQGKAWAMHDALFANQGLGFSAQQLRGLAEQIGLNLTKFDAAMQAHTYRAKVEALKKAALAVGVESTPSLFINGRRYDLDPILLTPNLRLAMERDRNRGNCK